MPIKFKDGLHTKFTKNFILFFILTLLTTITFNNCSQFESNSPSNIDLLNESKDPQLLINGAVSFFDLKSDQTQTHAFTLGYGFRKGDISNIPVIKESGIQVIVKKRWNDGSVKHAVFSGQVALSANISKRIYIFNEGAASTNNNPINNLKVDDIMASHPEATVDLGGIGTVSLSNILNTPFRIFYSGPEMIEAHYRSAVSGSSNIIVWFHVRLYKGGKTWIRAIIENGLVDDKMASVNYTPTITIGNKLVFNNSASVLNHFPHTRWMAEGWSNDPTTSAQKLEIFYDVNYLANTKLVPNYWKSLPSSAPFNDLIKSYVPMKNGNLTPHMGETGFQDQIGLLPKWDSAFVASGSNEARLSVLANSSSLNSYPVIWRDPTSNQIPKPTDWPSWAIQGGTYEIASGPFTWEVAHAPSEGYLAYLISGDYWHYETMAMQVATIYLSRSSTTGVGLEKLLLNQTRGTAWNLRTLSQFVALAPDDETDILNEYQKLLEFQLPGNSIFLHKRWDMEAT